MRAKKGRGAKALPVPPGDSQKSFDSPNLSVIERASFMEGLQQNYGNPLHSTAMEDELNASERAQTDKGRPGGNARAGPGKGEVAKKKKRVDGGQAHMRSDRTNQTTRKVAEKKGAKRTSIKQMSAVRPRKDEHPKDKERERESGSGSSSDAESQEESDAGTSVRRRRNIVPSSDEEVEDSSWEPNPKKAKVYRLGVTRKSSSGTAKSRKSSSGSTSPDPLRDERRGRGGSELEVVLDAFLDFCEQYRDSLESKAVKQSIDSFSNNVKEQILEKISSYKDFRVLKQENIKVASLIRAKTQRLLDAKHELMTAERSVWRLQKEKAELELRLADLQRSQSFLHDIGELNRTYLDYRRQHPTEREMYGASSLPVLLLETKHLQGAEHQLRIINKHLRRSLR
ncbi:centromere protein U [Aulostomus maculatus]